MTEPSNREKYLDPNTGYFKKGNPGKSPLYAMKGSQSQIVELRKAMLQQINPDVMRMIVARHMELIQGKDEKVAVKALELFYDRLFGKAKESVEIEHKASNPIDLSMYTDEQWKQIAQILDQPQVIDVKVLDCKTEHKQPEHEHKADAHKPSEHHEQNDTQA